MANVEFVINTGQSRTKLQNLTSDVTKLRLEFEKTANAAERLHAALSRPFTGAAGGTGTVGGVMGVGGGGGRGGGGGFGFVPGAAMGGGRGGGPGYAPIPQGRALTYSTVNIPPNMPRQPPGAFGFPRNIPMPGFLAGFGSTLGTVGGIMATMAIAKEVYASFAQVGEAAEGLSTTLMAMEQDMDMFRRNAFGPGTPTVEANLRVMAGQLGQPVSRLAPIYAGVASAIGGDPVRTQQMMRDMANLTRSMPVMEAAQLQGGVQDVINAAGDLDLTNQQAAGVLAGVMLRSRPVTIDAIRKRFPRTLMAGMAAAELGGLSKGQGLQDIQFLFANITRGLADTEARLAATSINQFVEGLRQSELNVLPQFGRAGIVGRIQFLQNNPQYARYFWNEEMNSRMSAQVRAVYESSLFAPGTEAFQAFQRGPEYLSETALKQRLDKDFKEMENAAIRGLDKILQNLSRTLETAFENIALSLEPDELAVPEELRTRYREIFSALNRDDWWARFSDRMQEYANRFLRGGFMTGEEDLGEFQERTGRNLGDAMRRVGRQRMRFDQLKARFGIKPPIDTTSSEGLFEFFRGETGGLGVEELNPSQRQRYDRAFRDLQEAEEDLANARRVWKGTDIDMQVRKLQEDQRILREQAIARAERDPNREPEFRAQYEEQNKAMQEEIDRLQKEKLGLEANEPAPTQWPSERENESQGAKDEQPAERTADAVEAIRDRPYSAINGEAD